MALEIHLSSGNSEKIRVLTEVWSDIAVIKTPGLLGLKIPDDLESAHTYEENALMKAEWLFKITGQPTIADDTGMEITSLGGAPGVLTRRWVEDPNDEEALIKKTIDEISKLPESDRKCDFVIFATAILNIRTRINIVEKDSGVLLLSPRGERIPGHPLASLLWIPDQNLTLAELQKKPGFESKDVRAHKKLKIKILNLSK